jgi:AraC family transcriptional regulator
MTWQDITWNIPLETQPLIVNIGENVHGRNKDEKFLLPDLWCLHLYAYEGELEVDGVVLPIRPGFVGINPPGATMIYHYLGRSPHLYVHFSIGPGGPTYPVPAMRDLQKAYEPTVNSFREALRFWQINRSRSVVRLWDILWEMADVSNEQFSEKETIPEAVHLAVQYIDTHLHEQISVEQLARARGMSHNHFTRIFRASKGRTPMEYIQNRRISQAKHLLVYSSLPIKTVAKSVGVSDPQIFNKFVKHYVGVSPKRLRDDEQAKVGLLD